MRIKDDKSQGLQHQNTIKKGEKIAFFIVVLYNYLVWHCLHKLLLALLMTSNLFTSALLCTS